MDPVTMILGLAMRYPQATESAIANYNQPGQVQATALSESISDFAIQTLSCYHKSARFRGVKVLGAPWTEQHKFGAEQSAVLRIDLAGITGTTYQMWVAAMVKGNSYRAFVLRENTIVPYNKHCSLEAWVSVVDAGHG